MKPVFYSTMTLLVLFFVACDFPSPFSGARTWSAAAGAGFTPTTSARARPSYSSSRPRRGRPGAACGTRRRRPSGIGTTPCRGGAGGRDADHIEEPDPPRARALQERAEDRGVVHRPRPGRAPRVHEEALVPGLPARRAAGRGVGGVEVEQAAAPGGVSAGAGDLGSCSSEPRA